MKRIKNLKKTLLAGVEAHREVKQREMGKVLMRRLCYVGSVVLIPLGQSKFI